MGFLADPSYGGNRGQVGWKLIGFEPKPAWKPPFGYYDAEEHH
jgi:gluconate 2-dehydrogenase gamma chain